MLEDAQLSWQLGDQVLAKKLLLSSMNKKDIETSLTRATALRIFGIILAESSTEPISTVIDKFFRQSLKLLDKIDNLQTNLLQHMKMSAATLTTFISENRIRAYESIAMYADREYNRLVVYMKSDTYLAKQARVDKNTQITTEMKVTMERSSKSIDMKRSYASLIRTTDIDRTELQSTESEYVKYLTLALHNFVKVAALQTEHCHSVVFRLISLWFSNKRNAAVTQHLRDHLPSIPSYKFVGVIPQVAARIGNGMDDSSRLVEQLMGKCVGCVNQMKCGLYMYV